MSVEVEKYRKETNINAPATGVGMFFVKHKIVTPFSARHFRRMYDNAGVMMAVDEEMNCLLGLANFPEHEESQGRREEERRTSLGSACLYISPFSEPLPCLQSIFSMRVQLTHGTS